MHELSLCKSILDLIDQQVSEKKCARVQQIIIELGQLVAVEKKALVFSFDVIKVGTVAALAELHIIEIPGEALCNSCQKKVPLRQYYEACEICGGHSLTVTQGEEFRLKSMVVE